ncbi:MAG: Hpt domain-containing protein [Pirellulales bacterium]|nr:Hpt domain-containing protein [Pirellulales bacterium]
MSTTMGADAHVIEFDELLDRCLGNLELMERAIEAFVAQFPAELDQVEDALARGCKTEAAAVAHRMKGSASNISATALVTEIANLETASLRSSGDCATQSCSRLRSEWERLLQAIG